MQKAYRVFILILALTMTTTQAAPLDGRGCALDPEHYQHEHSSRAPNSNTLGPRQPSHMPLVISTTSVLVSRTWGVTLQSLLDNGAIKPFEDVLVNNDKKVFDPEINDIEFGEEITEGVNNHGIWEVVSYRGQPRDDLIAKFFREAKSEEYGEVKALKMMNLLVESGKTMDPQPLRKSSLLPVIIMKKKEGITCRQFIENSCSKDSSHSQAQGPLLDWKQTKKMMCKQAAKDAVKFLVFHDDNSDQNGLVTIDEGSVKVELVDYGDAYMVIDKSIPEETFYKACIGE
ncbi:hypothetical protein DFJ43DRAFT_1225642 [Lentinula guzmanii]|uniref:Protein kinase domain-containing protein n=1 Tax=Lentinula guzmanii TaxID=2804957 RepID=A0AA38MZ26_9AGAR|nr:hypothetical protein DFJ43DRAFT_1225642 [Lentinula guzmanii]